MISIFDVTGPVMIGPSSSHTAGAARLARVARAIADGPFHHVAFGLHGSFYGTYLGHGTDRALVAGSLGVLEDDEAIRDAFALADAAGVTYEFYRADLEGVHENSVEITFSMENGEACRVLGSSVGGAQIVIRQVNGFDTEFTANLPTLIVRHRDRRGMVSEISRVLADSGINIGVMRLSRRARGDMACCVVEADSPIPAHVAGAIAALDDVYGAQAVSVPQGEV